MNFYANTRLQKALSTNPAGTAVAGRSCDSRRKNVSDHAGRVFGVSRTSIHNWLKAHRKGGGGTLKAHKRGPKHQSRLAGHQAATIVRLITDRCPDQLKLPFALWTREAVRQLIGERCGISISVWTAGG